MVKVCHITSVHDRYDTRIFIKECKSLAKNGYDVTLLVNDGMESEIIEDVKICSIENPYRGRKERIIKGRKEILKKALEINADIYHLHDPELLLIANKLKKHSKKVIFDSHEHYVDQIKTKEYLPKLIRKSIARLYGVYENYIFSIIDGLIYVGNLIDEEGEEFSSFTKKCKFVEKIENYPMLLQRKRVERNSSLNNITVCYAGTLSASRGIEQLVDSCYKANVRLILAGNFASKEFEDNIRSRESFKCVDYRGICSLEEVYDIYDESDIGAQLSLDMGQYYNLANFGVKEYEYMQMKLPIITFDSLYNKIMIQRYNFGICVNPYNLDEVIEAIKTLKENEELRKLMGENGYKLQQKEFSWSNEEIKLIQLYKNVLGE